MESTTLYLVRHGETEYNRRRIMQGRRIDSSLNATGRRQAAALAQRFEGVHFDAVYTSAMKRTMQTARPVLAACNGAVVHRLEDLDEMCWGIHEGAPWSDRLEAVIEDMYARWDRREFDHSVEEGESILDVQKRGLRAVEHIVTRHPGETVLVVTHGRFLRVLLSTILHGGLESMNDFDHANTGVNIVTFCEGVYSSTLLNCTAHLIGASTVLVE